MTDNRTTELLPCPMCGGQPDFQHFNITPNVQGRIICSCGIELWQGKNDTEDDMRIIWNTRSDYAVQAENERKAEQAIAATLGNPNATSDQESIVRSFLRKISPNRDWDYLGEHEHAMIADLVDDIAATLGSDTCHMSFIDEYETASGEEEYLCECSECGYRRWEPACNLPLFCSKCGKKVSA